MDRELLPENNKNKRKITAAVIIFAVMIVLFIFVMTKFVFVIKEITVSESAFYSNEEILNEIGIEKGESLILFGKSTLEDRLSEKFPYLGDVEINISLPGTVAITFNDKSVFFEVNMGNDLFLVDDELNVLEKKSPSSKVTEAIPLHLSDVLECMAGKKLSFYNSSSTKKIPEFFSTLETLGMIEDVSEIDAGDTFDVYFQYLGRFNVRLGELDNSDYKLALLLKVCADIDEKSVCDVDLASLGDAFVKVTSKLGT